jgi:O-antigen/teichoic acid export membrane protein
MLYWVLAARLYGETLVGNSSAVISAVLLITAISMLGLGGGMNRFVPRAGEHTRRLVLTAYAVVIAMSIALSVGFLLLVDVFGMRKLVGDGTLAWLGIISATMLWSIFRLQDQVLIGLRQAIWVLIENSIFNVAKIVVLVAGAGWLGQAIVTGSYFGPTAIAIALVTWLIFGVYTRPERLKPAPADLPALTIREVALTSMGDHIGSLSAEAASRLLPLLIVAILGAAPTAHFSMAWLIASMLSLVAGAMTDSFTTEAARDRAHIGKHSRDIMKYMAAIVIPAAVIMAVGAPLLLWLFGRNYAEQGTALLRWLALPAPLVVFNTWYLAFARVMGRIRQVIWFQVTGAVTLLGVSFLLLRPLGIVATGIAWLASQIVLAVIAIADSRSILFSKEAAE